MITYCCEKKIAGVLPTATGPAKHLFRQIEKKLEQLMIEYAEQFPTFTTIQLSTLKFQLDIFSEILYKQDFVKISQLKN